MAKPSKKAKAPKRERTERRFEPRSTANPILVQVLGALGAAALGAGFYGQFLFGTTGGTEPLKLAPWVLAAGAVLLGVAIWLGTSGEPALRVGDGGVGVEKGGVRRMPWHAVESLRFDRASQALTARGVDETGAGLTVVASLGSQPQAVAWIVKEARARIPDVLEIDEDVALPDARTEGVETLALEPLQVVGKRCAESDKVIAYEPDARVCAQCERVYHKSHVPEACRCGASLASLRPRKSAADPDPEAPSEAAAEGTSEEAPSA